MQKIKLYLDTSVISHIEAPDVPQNEAITRAFFRWIGERADEYELIISPIVDAEVNECPEPKRSRLLAFMDKMRVVRLPASLDAADLSRRYVEQGILSQKHIRDLMHVAYATISRCDFVVSWNMKHLVNARTIHSVNIVNLLNHYANAFIVTPLVVIGEQTDEND